METECNHLKEVVNIRQGEITTLAVKNEEQLKRMAELTEKLEVEIGFTRKASKMVLKIRDSLYSRVYPKTLINRNPSIKNTNTLG